MTTRKNPITSILAHNSVKESKAAMYVKIVAGLEWLKVGGTFNEIAIGASLRPEQVWKRLSEMEKLGLIFNTGITRPGLSGRSCTVWQLSRFQNNLKVASKVIQQDLFSQTK